MMKTEGIGKPGGTGLVIPPAKRGKNEPSPEALARIKQGHSAQAAVDFLKPHVDAEVERVIQRVEKLVRAGKLDAEGALAACYEISALRATIAKLGKVVAGGRAAGYELQEEHNAEE